MPYRVPSDHLAARAANQRRYYARHRDEIAVRWAGNWRKTPEQRQRWLRANPEKRRAQRALQRAVAAGKLARPDRCATCNGIGRRIEAHHEDYGLPLLVVWVCRRCHEQIHRARLVA